MLDNFDNIGVLVLLDGKKKGDKQHSLPKNLRNAVKGNTLPFLVATDPTGEKPILGFSAQYVKTEKAVKEKARELKDLLREDESLVQVEAEEDPDSPNAAEEAETKSPTLLAESQEWTNKEGVAITAAVQKVESGKVYFVMPNGNVVAYPVENLSAETVTKLRGLVD